MTTYAKNLLITDSDLDGIGCAVLMEIFFKSKYIQFCNPTNIDEFIIKIFQNQDIHKYENVFITDLSVSEINAKCLDMHNINSEREKTKLYDHHKTAEWLNDYSWANVNVTIDGIRPTCGTRIFWDMIWNNKIDGIIEHDDLVMQKCHRFVELVRLYDTFEWKNDSVLGSDALDLNYLFKVYDRDEFINKMVSTILDPIQTSILSQEDRGIIKCVHMKKDKYFKNKMKRIQLVKYEDYTVAVLYAEEYVSELGNHICETNDNIDFAALILVDEEQVSLRSTKDDVDVSEIARKFGGGGHKHAAGYPMKGKFNNHILNCLFTK